jgi:soluble lytic murein transglycosylase-like protein
MGRARSIGVNPDRRDTMVVHAKIAGFTKLHCLRAAILWHAHGMRARLQNPLAMLILAGLAVAGPARADVMVIDAGGPQWITGGPARPAHAVPQTAPRAATVPVQWRATIAALAERYDLSPAMIEALIWQESRWHANAVSRKGARGLMQLMPQTARAMGADAADPVQNVAAGARYLRQLIDSFHGNLELALAAYNAGPGRVARAGGIPPIAETRAYVAAILARLAPRVAPRVAQGSADRR